ncbi:tectonic-like isoform X1 [Musca autumnalis]|uniref:tectonic-like isoform X1 n=1 Tax=Musca autumnalis TaxID=221902 RepID=UPI003CE83AAE
MSYQKLLLLSCIILPSLIVLDAVKIGISKPLDTTTTSTTQSTVSTTEEVIIDDDVVNDHTNITDISPGTSTAPPPKTTTESEWPEFPPRKETTTSTKKPTTTTASTTKKSITKKSRTTTTKSPTTTTPLSSDTTNTTEIPVETSALASQNAAQHSKYCFCDLIISGCDINCCCDPDCPTEAFKRFRCLKESPNDFELHEGRFEDFKFQHGLPTCEEKDGWLCVFRTNLPSSDATVRVHASFSDTSHYYKWPNLLVEDVPTSPRDYYVYGDPLKLVNVETKEVRNFELPSSLGPPYCQAMEPIKYLKSQKRECLQSIEKLDKMQQNLVDLQDKYKVLQKPNLEEHLFEAKDLKKLSANISLRWCLCNSKKCHAPTEIHEEQLENTELNEIQITIYHNFTTIFGILIDLWHQEVEIVSDAQESWLTFDIKYINGSLKEVQKNLTSSKNLQNKSKISSGPYGYTLGKPIIMGKYVASNKSLPLSEKNQQLNFFSNDYEDAGGHTLNIMQKYKGLCGYSGESRDELEYISYGVNVAKQCKIRMNNETLHLEDPAKANYTAICLELQTQINAQLFTGGLNISDIDSYYISRLGKPQNHSEQWLQLNVFNADFNQVFGQYIENSATFVCRNILLSVGYEFHIGFVDFSAQQHQHIIEHAVLLMGERHDLEFALDELVEVPITMTVRFYDINEKAASASSTPVWSSFVIFVGLVLILNA